MSSDRDLIVPTSLYLGGYLAVGPLVIFLAPILAAVMYGGEFGNGDYQHSRWRDVYPGFAGIIGLIWGALLGVLQWRLGSLRHRSSAWTILLVTIGFGFGFSLGTGQAWLSPGGLVEGEANFWVLGLIMGIFSVGVYWANRKLALSLIVIHMIAAGFAGLLVGVTQSPYAGAAFYGIGVGGIVLAASNYASIDDD